MNVVHKNIEIPLYIICYAESRTNQIKLECYKVIIVENIRFSRNSTCERQRSKIKKTNVLYIHVNKYYSSTKKSLNVFWCHIEISMTKIELEKKSSLSVCR